MNDEICTSRLPELAQSINRAQHNIESLLNEAVDHAVAAGQALIEAKALVKHGEWQNWIADNCRISDRTARSYMRLARELPKLSYEKRQSVAVLPLRDVIAELATPKDKPDIDGTFLLEAPEYLTPPIGKFLLCEHPGDKYRECTTIYQSEEHAGYFHVETLESDDFGAGHIDFTRRPVASFGLVGLLEFRRIDHSPLDWELCEGKPPLANMTDAWRRELFQESLAGGAA